MIEVCVDGFSGIPQMGVNGNWLEAVAQIEVENATAENMKQAIMSIPAYVERASLMLVLVSVCLHQDH